MTPRELQKIRHDLGFSQEEMAEALGITRQHLCKLETAISPIKTTTAMAVRYLQEHHKTESKHPYTQWS